MTTKHELTNEERNTTVERHGWVCQGLSNWCNRSGHDVVTWTHPDRPTEVLHENCSGGALVHETEWEPQWELPQVD